MTDLILGLGSSLTVGGGTSGSLDLSVALAQDAIEGELFASTNFAQTSIGVGGLYASDSWEIGLYAGGVVPQAATAFWGANGGLFFDLGSRLRLGPGASADFSFTQSTPAPQNTGDGTHEYQTRYCGESSEDSSGIFSNDQGEGGCENRPLSDVAPGGIATGTSGLGVGTSISLNAEIAVVPDRLALELSAGALFNLYPQPQNQFLGSAAFVYTF